MKNLEQSIKQTLCDSCGNIYASDDMKSRIDSIIIKKKGERTMIKHFSAKSIDWSSGSMLFNRNCNFCIR